MTAERWALLKSLFDQALDLEDGDRVKFVRAACAGDAALERSLSGLLKHHEAASSVLAGPMLTPERMAEIVSSGLRTFVPGEIVARRFRIEQFLAEGGMGEVYSAKDLELSEMVALKTIRPVLASDDRVLAGFKQEIQLARKVTHRNVSRVYDLFRHEIDLDGVRRTIVFLSMELLRGETLAERIHRVGRFRSEEAQRVAAQLIGGLQAAHTAGIIHGDFKSANVALVADGEGPGRERVVIMDFGLAGTQSSLDEAASAGFRGTPAYAAPEQVENGTITAASDIYALGVVLFEMISGALPLQGKTPMETAQLRLLRGAPPLRTAAPDAPLVWERTVDACLARDPAKRPVSAAEVGARLTGRYERRRRLRAIATGICAAGLAGGGVYWAGLPHRPAAAAQSAADSARVKLENNTTTGLREAIGDYQRAIQLDPKWAQAWAELAYAYAMGANAKQVPAATASVEARAAALQAIRLDKRSTKAFGALGWVQSLDFDEWPKAEANLRRALALNTADAQVHYWLGVHLRKKGQFADAETEDRQGLALSHQADPAIWCELAFLYWTSGELDRMEQFMKELLVAYPNFGLTRFLEARLLKEQGKFEEALAELRFAESLQYTPVTVLAERASVEAYRGNAAAARATLLRLREASKTEPVDGLLMAGVYAKLGDFDSAFELLERGYAQRDSTLLSVATSPVLKPLSGDARFAALLRRLHFEP
jgi:tetratricopeptide (TPR) repeat protein